MDTSFRKRLYRKINRILGIPGQYWLDRKLSKLSKEEQFLLSYKRAFFEEDYKEFDNPLVSVIIPTYNRPELLINQCLKAIFNQTYQNFEVVIVGDCCPPEVAARLSAIDDQRVRFYNFPNRPNYPKNSFCRWLVIGAYARNAAIELAKGSWIAYVDDDDEWTPDHLEVLLKKSYEDDLELCVGHYQRGRPDGTWFTSRTPIVPDGKRPYGSTWILHSGVIYRSYLDCFRYLTDGYRYGCALDYLLTQRMGRAGVRFGHLDQVVVRQPLRPGEKDTTFNSVRRWPSWLNPILIPIFKNIDFGSK